MLPFDFYIPEKDLLIEVQGEQHVKDKFGDFEERQRLDKIKKDFAIKEHHFLEIYYYQNAEQVLKDFNLIN